MTDFVDDLERELLAAAHRDHGMGRRGLWRRVVWGRVASARGRGRVARGRVVGAPRAVLSGGAALVALAAVAALVAVLVRPTAERERTGVPPGAAFVPPIAAPTGRCSDLASPQPVVRPPAELAVLRRPQRTSERRLPVDQAWLPVGTFDPDSVRRPVPRLFVVPTTDVRTGPPACGPAKSRGPGACLVYAPSATHCFTFDEIRRSRAIALVDSEPSPILIALLPDGAAGLELADGVYLAARENAIAEPVSEVRLGQAIRYTVRAGGPEVLILNETKTEGLAAATRDQLQGEFPRIEIKVDAGAVRNRHTSVVRAASERFEPQAREIAAALGIQYRGIDPSGVGVIVRLGADRMR